MGRKAKFTAIEEYYIRGNVGKSSIEQIAKDLGKTEGALTNHIKEMGIDIEKITIENKLSGFYGTDKGVTVLTTGMASQPVHESRTSDKMKAVTSQIYNVG